MGQCQLRMDETRGQTREVRGGNTVRCSGLGRYGAVARCVGNRNVSRNRGRNGGSKATHQTAAVPTAKVGPRLAKYASWEWSRNEGGVRG